MRVAEVLQLSFASTFSTSSYAPQPFQNTPVIIPFLITLFILKRALTREAKPDAMTFLDCTFHDFSPVANQMLVNPTIQIFILATSKVILRVLEWWREF